MARTPVSPEIVDDLSLLYELSLSIGTSLDLGDNCASFLRTLMKQKGLDYAALWLRQSVLERDATDYALIYAYPKRQRPEPVLAADHALVECALAQRAITVREANPGYKALITERGITKGTFVIFRLGDIGFIKLHTPQDVHPFDDRAIKELQRIFDKFCTSIMGCIAHASQKEEIRERQAAQEEVARITRFYEQVLEVMPAQLAVFNAKCEYVYITPSAIKNDEIRSWLIGKTDVDYARRRGFDPRFAQQRMSTIQKVARTRETLQFEETITNKAGKDLHFVRFVTPVTNAEDEVTHVLGYGLEITPLKEAEQEQAKLLEQLWNNRKELLRTNDALQNEVTERKRAEKTLSGVLSTAGEGIIVINADSNIVMVNQAAETIWGYGEAELIGKPLDQLMPIPYRDAHKAGLDRYVRTGISKVLGKRLELEGLAKDGTIFPLEIYITETRLNDQLLFTGAVRNITARKQAEEALRQSEVRYRSLVESASDIIYQADSEGLFTYANPVAERLMGYSEDELIGRHFLELVQEEQREEVMAFYEKQVTEGIPSTYFEFVALTASGNARWLGQNVQLIWEDDTITGVQAVARDITEQREAEQALQQATQIAKESARVKEQFLANMSHEIRTPLNAVLGITHLLQNTKLSSEQAKYLKAIQYGADSLMGIINDLLDYAKIEADKILFEAIPFDLQELLTSLQEGIAHQTESKGLAFEVSADPEVPTWIVGDRVRLNQVLLNLLNNAIKFTESGRVSLHVTALEEQDEDVILQFIVADTGIGIHPTKLADIFEMFAQERSDTTRKYGGTGLGLSIVSELVTRQGGTIGVTSVLEEGSEFNVTLPFKRLEEEEWASIASEEHIEADLEGHRILVVEDNELNQMMAQRMLEQWGAEVEVANNGLGAIELVRQRHYDLVLMDIQMPEMDGYEATRHIRDALGLSLEALPIWALTASPLVSGDADMRDLGMNGSILKPFDPKRLRTIISTIFGLTSPPVSTTSMPDSSTPLVDLSLLEKSAFGKPELLKRLINISLKQIASMQANLETALAEQNAQDIGFVAHKMKASAGTLGITAWHELLGELEVTPKDTGLSKDVEKWVNQSGAFATQALSELEAALADLPT